MDLNVEVYILCNVDKNGLDNLALAIHRGGTHVSTANMERVFKLPHIHSVNGAISKSLSPNE